MQRERVSENVYWFQSEIYAQVTAGVIVGPHWAVVVDTLALPEETLAMRAFIEEQLNVPVRYIINTHYHADHSWGNCFFPGATIISHSICRRLMIERGLESLDAARKQTSSLRQVKLILPHLTFEQGTTTLRVGKKNLVLIPTPGHSEDGISVLIEEDRVLFAADAFMPLPYIVDGDLDMLIATYQQIGEMGLENVVQGHGDIVLRGEIDEAIEKNIHYLKTIREQVKLAIYADNPAESLKEITIESCGKQRVLLAGLADELHQRNLRALFRKYVREDPVAYERMKKIAAEEERNY